jgi:peptidoglycan/LPS O-acetylase OafA/YrhL
MECDSEPVVGNGAPDPLLERSSAQLHTEDERGNDLVLTPVEKKGSHLKEIPQLDGWRGISILLVLATHMLPVGPKRWQLNACTGAAGMSLFFTLSGFLITGGLLKNPAVRPFFIRRFCRIVPLSYLYTAIALLILGKGLPYFASSYLFLINYDYAHITDLTGHLWSLCVEMHFYIFVGLLVLVAGRRGLYSLPFFAAAITIIRIYNGVHISINTHLRVDEILAGACLSLCYYHPMAKESLRFLGAFWLPFVLMVLLGVCSHPLAGSTNYVRPYAAALLVGSTLWSANTGLHKVLASHILRYVATISYALYVFHPLSMYGWLGAGGVIKKYLLKRPISLAITLVAAHISTFYYEKAWIDWGKKKVKRIGEPGRENQDKVPVVISQCRI